MSESILKLQILVRAEMALARIHMQHTARRTAFFTVAVVFGLLGVGMITLAGYHALNTLMAPTFAALLVGLTDAALAIVIVVAAGRIGAGDKAEQMATELRDMAYAGLNTEIEEIKTDVRKITDDFNGIRSALTSFSSGAAMTITPILGLLAKTIKGN